MSHDFENMLQYILTSDKLYNESKSILLKEIEHRRNLSYVKPLTYNSLEELHELLVSVCFEYYVYKEYSILTHMKGDHPCKN